MFRFIPHRALEIGVALLVLAAPGLLPLGHLAAQSLAVASRAEGRISIIDLATLREIRSFETGPAPHEIAARPGAGLLYVPSYGGSGLQEIDLVAGETRTLIPGESEMHDIALGPGTRRLWVTSETDSTVLEIVPRSGEVVRRWAHGLEMGHMVSASPDGALLWVPDLRGEQVSRIDRRTGEVSHHFVGSAPEGIAVAPDGSEVWLTARVANEIVVLDSAGAELARFSSAGDFPVKLRISPDGAQVWVANNGSGEISVFDRTSRERLAVIPVGERPLGIGFSEPGDRAFVTRPGAAEIVEIDARSFEIVRRIPGPTSADGVVWLPALPAPDETLRFPAPDGTLLFADLHRTTARDTRGLILLFHQGGSSGRAEFRNVIPRLLERGWDAMAVDLREGGDRFGGMNRTVQAMGEIWNGGYGAVYPDLEASLDVARARAKGPVMVVGSSYSGTLSLQLAAQRTEQLAGVAAFSPASGEPLADCLAREFTDGVDLPILVVRPRYEAEIPSVRTDLTMFEAQGHHTWIADPGVHGASTLDPERTGGADDTWRVFQRWLEGIGR